MEDVWRIVYGSESIILSDFTVFIYFYTSDFICQLFHELYACILQTLNDLIIEMHTPV